MPAVLESSQLDITSRSPSQKERHSLKHKPHPITVFEDVDVATLIHTKSISKDAVGRSRYEHNGIRHVATSKAETFAASFAFSQHVLYCQSLVIALRRLMLVTRGVITGRVSGEGTPTPSSFEKPKSDSQMRSLRVRPRILQCHLRLTAYPFPCRVVRT